MRSYFISIERVSVGSLEHLLPIAIAIVLAFILIRYARKHFSEKQQVKAIHAFAILVSLTLASFHLYYIALGNYDFKTDLPLFLCSFMALTIPLFTYFRKYWMYEILVFWIIAGTSQGVITPDIPEGFPAFDYFRYWTAHLGLLIIIFYATFVFEMRPTLRSVIKSILALQVYIGLMMLLNYLLDANYSYLNYKPKSASVLDYLGEWPWYLVQAQMLLIPYFLLIYGLFQIGRKRTISQTID
ncbi:MAG: TIGR02206 family membrane protein [Bacteroidia bacterium]|nr:TIGR02206 family membrane protein [Bacteroidia bacterium]MBT8308846.1 TIGR02206 family membrane protein [Bacteroidia bacterium]